VISSLTAESPTIRSFKTSFGPDIGSLTTRVLRARKTRKCTDGPFLKPTVHSRHSCGTVEIVRESTYDGGGGEADEGERGSPSPWGEGGMEGNAVAVVIEVGVAPPAGAAAGI
jgi:hypothetical protein